MRPNRSGNIADVILYTSGSFYGLVFLGGAYRYFRDERAFSGLAGTAIFLAIYACAAGLAFGALWLRPVRRANVSLLLLSMTVSIFTAEAVLAYYLGVAAQPYARGTPTGAYDHRTRRQVVDDLRKAGVEAFPWVSPRRLLESRVDGSLTSRISIGGKEVLPLAGISNTTTVSCNETGEYLIYESDEHGFHNPKGIWRSRAIEVVALGDSFVQGACVPSESNAVALIRKAYPATLNLGMGGNGPLLMLATLKEFVEPVRPGVILWFYYEGNDLKNAGAENQSTLLRHYLEGSLSQELLTMQPDIDRALKGYVEAAMAADLPGEREAKTVARGASDALYGRLLKIAKLESLRSPLGLAFDPETGSDVELEVRLLGTALLRAMTAVQSWGGRLYFVYLPESVRYQRPWLVARSRERVLATVKKIGLPIIDIHPGFEARGDPLAFFPFRQHGHYNADGYRVVAEEVLRAISVGARAAR